MIKLKFRAWDGTKMYEPILSSSVTYRNDRDPVMQYTGLNYGEDVYVGDIIDINQTVNGQSKFVIVDCIGGFDVRYAYDLTRKYEYDVLDLLDFYKQHESENKVIGNMHSNPELIKQ